MVLICPVCIEPLVLSAESQVVSVSCGHVFHFQCMSDWLNEKSTCPTCRNSVEDHEVKKLYLEFGAISSEHPEEVASYVCQVESLTFEVKLKQIEIDKYKEKSLHDEEKKRGLRSEISRLETKMRKLNCNYADSMNAQENMVREMRKLRENLKEMDKLKQDLEEYKRLDSILHGSIETADSALKSGELEPDSLVMLVSSFKAAFEEAKQNVMNKDKTIQRITLDNINMKSQVENLTSQISTQDRVIETYKKTMNDYKRTGRSRSSNTALSDNSVLVTDTSITELSTFPNSSQFSQDLESIPRPSSSTSPQVPSPELPPRDNYYKKFSLKRRQDLSPVLQKKMKIVSSRLKRPQNP